MERTELLVQVRNIFRKAFAGRSICLIAPYLDRFYLPVIDQLRSAGADVRGVLTANWDPTSFDETRLPVFDMSAKKCISPGDRFEFVLASPPDSLHTWLDEIDPARETLLIGSQFTGVPNVCGRGVYGWRRPSWAEWEDKTLSAQRLDRIGVLTPRNVVLSASDPDVPEACKSVDTGFGVVIALCDTHGDQGGGSALRVVRTRRDVEELGSVLQERASRFRVSEFVPGIPCSVIGMVAGDHVCVYDPIEIVTLLNPETHRFNFCGSSTFWRPSAEVCSEMRSIAIRVGLAMARESGFRGGFSVDGILADRRFLVTEVNARYASGLGLGRIWLEFPLYLLGRCAVEGGPVMETFDAARFESAARMAISEQPSASILVPKYEGTPGRGTASLQFPDTTIHVTYSASANGSRARIISCDPFPPERLAGPAAARLAAILGNPNIISPADFPQIRSVWLGHSPEAGQVGMW